MRTTMKSASSAGMGIAVSDVLPLAVSGVQASVTLSKRFQP